MSGADGGAKNDLFGISGKDFVCHGVSNVFSDSDKIATTLAGFGWKVVVVNVVEDVFPPVESEEWADVGCRAGETGDRDIVMGATNGVVQNEAYVEDAE